MWKWLKRLLCGSEIEMTTKDRINDRRSRVRVNVTYWASAYIFAGIPLLIVLAIWGKLTDDNFSTVREVFTIGVPIATGIITYWFATRPTDKKNDDETNGPNGLTKKGDVLPPEEG